MIILRIYFQSVKNMKIVKLALFFMYASLHIFRFYMYCWVGQCLIDEVSFKFYHQYPKRPYFVHN